MIEFEVLASRLGYRNEVALWEDLYVTKGLSLSQISRKLDVSRNVIRLALARAGIPPRKRGGPNNARVVLTQELIDEIRRDGLPTVARRLGLSHSTLYKRLRLRGLSIRDLREPGKAESVVEAQRTGQVVKPSSS